jgi:cytidylate kinase/pantoate ligase/cytidylate kinase
MIVTIDGPAGAGKSTIAKDLARRLGFQFLDTGAMYRALTWRAQQAGVDLKQTAELETFSLACPLEMRGGALWAAGSVLGPEIRTTEVARDVHYVADNPRIRRYLVNLQRRWVCDQDFVSEGRDQGTVAFPNAFCKFFLTATPETRARRRQRQLAEQGQTVPYEEILAAQVDRDRRDQSRPAGRLMKALDAITIATDDWSIDQVVERLLQIAVLRRATEKSSGPAVASAQDPVGAN